MRLFELPNQSFRWLLAELAVVVLGILIAFQVDEWRTGSADKEFADSSLEAIMLELEDEYSDFQLVIPSVATQLNSASRLFTMLSSKDSRHEAEIIGAFRGISGGYGWIPNAPTYTGLRESGRIYLISDPVLIDSLFDYYEFEEYVGRVMDTLGSGRDKVRATSITDVYTAPANDGLEDSITIPLERRLALPLEDIPRNPEFFGALGLLLRNLNSAARRFEEVAIRNLALQKIIRTHLSN